MGTQSTTADVLWGQLSTREKILLLILNTGTLACGLTIERAFLLFLVSIGVQYCGCLAVLFLISHKVEPMQLMGSGCAIALIVPVGCALMKFAGFHFDVALVVGLNCCLATFGAILSILPAQIIRLDGKKEEQDTPSPPSVPDATPSTPVPQVNNLNAVKERELTIRLLYSMVPPKIARCVSFTVSLAFNSSHHPLHPPTHTPPSLVTLPTAGKCYLRCMTSQ
jgi:hypothetical protein